jgi:hypothetical protein
VVSHPHDHNLTNAIPLSNSTMLLVLPCETFNPRLLHSSCMAFLAICVPSEFVNSVLFPLRVIHGSASLLHGISGEFLVLTFQLSGDWVILRGIWRKIRRGLNIRHN